LCFYLPLVVQAYTVGAKAVASVEMAVPPTMVAGELNVEISEGETSGDDFSDGDYTDIDE
jgi:hypothetical protein